MEQMTSEEVAFNGLTMVLNTNAYIGTCEMSDLVVACAALAKQIAKEPAIEIQQGMEIRKCPECGRALFSDKYCGDCGQLIKQE